MPAEAPLTRNNSMLIKPSPVLEQSGTASTVLFDETPVARTVLAIDPVTVR